MTLKEAQEELRQTLDEEKRLKRVVEAFNDKWRIVRYRRHCIEQRVESLKREAANDPELDCGVEL